MYTSEQGFGGIEQAALCDGSLSTEEHAPGRERPRPTGSYPPHPDGRSSDNLSRPGKPCRPGPWAWLLARHHPLSQWRRSSSCVLSAPWPSFYGSLLEGF